MSPSLLHYLYSALHNFPCTMKKNATAFIRFLLSAVLRIFQKKKSVNIVYRRQRKGQDTRMQGYLTSDSGTYFWQEQPVFPLSLEILQRYESVQAIPLASLSHPNLTWETKDFLYPIEHFLVRPSRLSWEISFVGHFTGTVFSVRKIPLQLQIYLNNYEHDQLED